MASKMLIDAAHPEETRVVVVRGNRVEEFDYEISEQEATQRQYLSCQGHTRRAVACRRPSSITAATGTASWPLLKFIPTITKSRSRTGRRCSRKRRPRKAALAPRRLPRTRPRQDAAAGAGGAAAGVMKDRGQGRRDAQSPSGAPAEAVSVAKFEPDEEDEIDTTPREDPPVVAMEAADLIHKVSEPAREPDAETDEHNVDTAPGVRGCRRRRG